MDLINLRLLNKFIDGGIKKKKTKTAQSRFKRWINAPYRHTLSLSTHTHTHTHHCLLGNIGLHLQNILVSSLAVVLVPPLSLLSLSER